MGGGTTEKLLCLQCILDINLSELLAKFLPHKTTADRKG
jgi:hypothetical protein